MDEKEIKRPVKKVPENSITRLNILRTNDNRIMVDIKALEAIIGNQLIKLAYEKNDEFDPNTLLCVKDTLASIAETAVLRIQEQNATSTRYVNNTIKEIELDSKKLFK